MHVLSSEFKYKVPEHKRQLLLLSPEQVVQVGLHSSQICVEKLGKVPSGQVVLHVLLVELK